VRSTRLRIEFFFHAQPVTIHKRTPLKRTLCSGLRVVRLRKFKSVLLLTFITLKLRYLLFSMMTLYSSVPSSNTCLKHKNKISTEYVSGHQPWLEQKKSHAKRNCIRFPGHKILHKGRHTPRDNQRGYKARTTRRDVLQRHVSSRDTRKKISTMSVGCCIKFRDKMTSILKVTSCSLPLQIVSATIYKWAGHIRFVRNNLLTVPATCALDLHTKGLSSLHFHGWKSLTYSPYTCFVMIENH